MPTREHIDQKPTSEQRSELAAQDTRDDDDRVATTPNGAYTGGYAYHELDEDGELVCGGHSDGRFVEVTRAEAKRTGKTPCGKCEWLLELQTESSTSD
ncbi:MULTISPECIES: hypothetical protein [Haloferax]|uniref:Uncharacterized protein n=2 Tax=Haloferax gibbonsii TaxID=35746 RepID=A0A0K1IUR8_HALGI|nr:MULTISPECIES: hypothetical protein [Haloferax]AKU08179.1 hypothetical protein ABY42_10715 [Haloferax gibbonsii]ELZ79877.1 hypothetical protein C454_11758 [Haloferax gibbonsii ATCC 33959]RDZ52662.1 hypothetical protein C5C07_12875 [Haloferax sp. Atlit-4N]REA03835.1 hypothetical protein DEQ92_12070 [Haloferax sp. Atlit-6N]